LNYTMMHGLTNLKLKQKLIQFVVVHSITYANTDMSYHNGINSTKIVYTDATRVSHVPGLEEHVPQHTKKNLVISSQLT
jgi:hypothetical protein